MKHEIASRRLQPCQDCGHLSEVSRERDDPDRRVTLPDCQQLRERSVIGAVVDEHELAVVADEIGSADGHDLFEGDSDRSLIPEYRNDERDGQTAPTRKVATISQMPSTTAGSSEPYSGRQSTCCAAFRASGKRTGSADGRWR